MKKRQRLPSTRRSVLTAVSFVTLAALSGLGCSKTPEPDNEPKKTVSERVPVRRKQVDDSFKYRSKHRVVAFGDVHGDLDATKRALRTAGVLGEDGHWNGGDTVVVQVGDVLDRGDHEVAIMSLLERLGEEAKSAGGRVFELLGNHELMNMQGDFRYVTKAGFDVFNEMSSLPNPAGPRFARLPIVARSRAAAFFPPGPYAKKLARYPVVVQVDDTVFVHGGLLPKHVDHGVGKINRQTKAWALGKRRSLPSVMMGEDAPVWTRVYSMPSVGAGTCRMLGKVLAGLHAKRMVVGHTPQKNGITSACDGQVWRVDVGLASFYGSHPVEVLQISDGHVTILKQDGLKQNGQKAGAARAAASQTR